MSNNINQAAMLRKDARTVVVVIPSSHQGMQGSEIYTYLADKALNVERGDDVTVYARGQLKLAKVTEVDDTVDFPPNSSIKLQWIVGVVDTEDYLVNTNTDAGIQEAIEAVADKKLRKQVRKQLLSTGADEDMLNEVI
ncbi:MAG: hypothetical protein PF440_11485 [Thiomicrorhabdus sp.]|jgi:hypothetical protein|nr:hypothetical protein [Thiomicrorhabdus sp.]